MFEHSRHSTFRIVLGLGFVATGVLFTLSNLGIVDTDQWVRWWPSLLILYGLLRIFGIWCRSAWVTGSLIVVVGTWWLLHNLGILTYDVLNLWPLLLVFMGIGVMRRSYWGRSFPGIGFVGVSRRGRAWRMMDMDEVSAAVRNAMGGAHGEGPGATGGATGATGGATGGGSLGAAAAEFVGAAAAGFTGAEGTGNPGANPGNPGAGSETQGRRFRWRRAYARSREAEGMVAVDAFMSSVTRTVSSQDFKGGDVVALMGGAEIDLRPARIQNPPARIEVNLLMGGLTLYVPPDWVVEFQGTPIMGGIDDQTHRPAGEIRGRLMLTGIVLLSGIVIRN